MDIFTLETGHAPLLVSLPHDGSFIPDAFRQRMVPSAHAAPDTDWHVARLYDFARRLGASILRPNHSRYVVDLNRPPDDVSLYPGQNTTGLCPDVQFSGEPVYLAGQTLTADEIAQRRETYWRPYHDALSGELERLRAKFARVVLWDGHSIRGELPYLFEGRLPDLNLGTASGSSCAPDLQAGLAQVLQGANRYSHVVNGRFKGGYITRHYGQPNAGVHAVQLELAQATYMDEASTHYLPEPASGLQTQVLEPLLQAALTWARS
jgi:N-formylglutamate deformylase